MLTLSPNATIAEQGKQSLLRAALKLFAENGIDAVSLRMINREAGHKNHSALHYHFGSKMGLLESLAEFIQNWFEESRESALVAVETSDTVDGKKILEAFVTPYLNILKEEWGYDAVRFIARMEFDADSDTHHILNKFAGPSIERFKKLLVKTYPELPKKLLFQRFNFCITSIIMGLADYKSLKDSYMGNLNTRPEDLVTVMLDVCSHGLGAPCS
ncbi:TetR/AcrR family transcriptional regulator [Litorivivens sp.]|uniref:TetR/AcrR family transcriptional regulator n=1 Tax=Litorivivens sp. TaxID=2020868 RepID=UPI003565CD1F